MKLFRNLCFLGTCSSFSYINGLRYVQVRNFVKTPIVMRSKKKQHDFSFHTDEFTTNKKIRKRYPKYVPKSDNQKTYVHFLQNSTVPIVLGVGPAGCGKTMFACIQAIQELQQGTIDKIILTRPIVPVEEEELGFLPGNLVKKMDPWTRPIFDIFSEFYQQRDIENMIHCGILEISPLAYMRGRTFKNSFIIADEMQNSSPNQMLMLTTRIGEESKMVITGDLKQSDRSVNNGLLDFMNKLSSYETTHNDIGVKLITLTSQDVQRSPIVTQILNIYNDNDNDNTIDPSYYENSDALPSNKSIPLSINNNNNDAALIPIDTLPKNNFDNNSQI